MRKRNLTSVFAWLAFLATPAAMFAQTNTFDSASIDSITTAAQSSWTAVQALVLAIVGFFIVLRIVRKIGSHR